MEMQFVHYKTQFPAAKETVAQATPTAVHGTSGYSVAVTKATTAPLDPAGVAVISYMVDVGFFYISFFAYFCIQIDVPLFRSEPQTQSWRHSLPI